ncbi:MAG TPA: hypothetical protein VL961_12600, partial [Acidimicrobiales bacterium]|nr:hypothetical protein [Acidimicrobiales bacterium]
MSRRRTAALLALPVAVVGTLMAADLSAPRTSAGPGTAARAAALGGVAPADAAVPHAAATGGEGTAVAVVPSHDGGGYLVGTTAGDVIGFGDATATGSAPGHLNAPIVGMAAAPDGGGYWLVGADGGIFTFGDARFDGSATTDLDPLAVDELADTDGAQQMIIVDASSSS